MENECTRRFTQCKKTAVVISGGEFDEAFALKYCSRLSRDRILIAADAGVRFCMHAEVVPDFIVGDFDSFDGENALRRFEEMGVVIRRFKPEKDQTDTQIAAELAMEQGCTEIHLLGGTGGRLDHLLGNLQVMELCLRSGVRLVMADPHNRITMYDEPFEVARSACEGYVSFVPWGGPVEGVTLTGFKYPLREYDLQTEQALGISNELAEETGYVTFHRGKLLMILSAD